MYQMNCDKYNDKGHQIKGKHCIGTMKRKCVRDKVNELEAKYSSISNLYKINMVKIILHRFQQ